MTFQIGFLFALLFVMVVLFLTEKLAVDLTAFLGLIILIFGGYLTPAEAFTGFSSPAVITMMSVFIVGASLLETGVADLIGSRIHNIVGDSELRLVAVLMIVAGVLSAFMNNIAATAVLMPAVASIAQRSGMRPSRLFMPLAFGAILGGTTTLVGTPPNILAAQMLEERGLEPFTLFDFTPIGLAILAVGTIFMLTIGRKLLPVRDDRGPGSTERGELSQVYQLQERLFSIRLPDDSPLDGKTLAETRFGNTLGIKVVAIVHKGRRILAPDGDAVTYAGDVLLVNGKPDDVERLQTLKAVRVESTQLAALPAVLPGVGGIRARIARNSPLIGKTLRQLDFRRKAGVVVIGVRRGEEIVRDHLAEFVFAEGDRLFALGTRRQLTEFADDDCFDVRDLGFSAIAELQDYLHLISVPESSPLVGRSISSSRLGELVGITVTGVIRGGRTRLAIPPDEAFEAGDQLLIAADPEPIERLLKLGQVELVSQDPEAELQSEEIGMVEAAIAPRSSAAGSTLKELDFRDRFGLLALAIWRRGTPIHKDLTDIKLEFGDALLLQGPRDKIRRIAASPDFVVLSDADQVSRRTSKAKWSFAGLALMVALVATGYQPIHVAAFTAASLVVLFGTLSMQEAYRAIEWRAIFLVAAVLPVGVAMERTGAATLLADGVAEFGGAMGPYGILAALIVLASLVSQGLDGAPAVVLLAPVVIQSAEQMGVSPYPLMMGVSLAASAAFMTPFSHKANLLVMGAGGYRSMDYLKVGTPLTIILLAMMVFLIPIFFPF